MAISKVLFNECVVMDITDSTVTADSLLEGKKAYDKDGEPVIGTMKQQTGPTVDLSQVYVPANMMGDVVRAIDKNGNLVKGTVEFVKATVTATQLLSGQTAIDKNGNLVKGTLKITHGCDTMVTKTSNGDFSYTFPYPLTSSRFYAFALGIRGSINWNNYTESASLSGISWARCLSQKVDNETLTYPIDRYYGTPRVGPISVYSSYMRYVVNGASSSVPITILLGAYDSV